MAEYKTNMNEGLEKFRAFRVQFDALMGELHVIHEEWQKIHSGSADARHPSQHDDLIRREVKLVEELDQLMKSVTELISFYTKSSDKPQ